MIDPANNETDWTFSAVNLPLTETNALGTTTTTYNPDLNATSITDADGRERDFEYDNDQRLTAENWMNGGTVVASMNYGYDLGNELTSASDPNSAYAFAYDGDGNVTSVDNNGTPNVPRVVLSSAYDLLGDRTSLSATINGTADFLNNYSYDADRNLTLAQQQQQSGGNTVSPKEIDYGYNAIGQISGTADFNFIGVGPRLDVLTGAYSYDNGDRLTGRYPASRPLRVPLASSKRAASAAFAVLAVCTRRRNEVTGLPTNRIFVVWTRTARDRLQFRRWPVF